MKILRKEVKIFLTVYFSAVIAFFLIFAVGMAVVYEHRLVSARLSAWFIGNFFISMFVYFILVAAFSFLSYRSLKNAVAEVKIFVVSYGLSFITFLIALAFLLPIYFGNDPPWLCGSYYYIILSNIWTFYMFLLSLLFLGLVSLLPAGFFVLVYEIDKIVVWLADRRMASKQRKQKN